MSLEKGKAPGQAPTGTPERKVMAIRLPSGQTLRIDKDRAVIGSVVSADVQLAADGVSPLHAVIEVIKDDQGRPLDRAAIYDLASETGVFVNGAKVITQPLKNGDELTIGSLRLKFALEELTPPGPREPSVQSQDGRRLFLNPNEDLSALLLVDEANVEEIFDHRPESKQALEVVMSWHGTILDVEHFVKEKAVNIGPQSRNHFAIPPILTARRFPIVTRAGESFTLHVDSSMTGVIQRKGRLQTIDQVRKETQHSGSEMTLPLEKDDFAKVSLGEGGAAGGAIDFYLSFTAAPPRLRSRRLVERDPLFLKIMISSLLLTAATVTGLRSAQVPQNLEAEPIPERLATILYQPEKFSQFKKPEPVKKATDEAQSKAKPPKPTPQKTVKVDLTPKKLEPKPIPKQMDVAEKTQKAQPKAQAKSQDVAKEGEGTRAKGKEGLRGSKTAAPGKENQTAAKRPSPQGGTGRGGGNSQVGETGNVDMLKGASDKIQNLLGNVGQNLGKGGSKISGFGGFNTLGGGGLALSGTGKGGGGSADTLAGGLGAQGTGGGRVGTGLGASGTGNGIIGGKTRVVIRTGGPDESVVMGSIDKDAIIAALEAHRDEFRLCYEKEINAEHPDIGGTIVPSFVIGASGRVTQAGIESASLKNENVQACVIKVIKRIDFPQPKGGGIVQVTYPFKFRSTGTGRS